ncbi:hypothetical protein [Magnetovibrio sp.]|uniref:hypothetical protein n=1 Tax=Magnetovibrio sp. TaxID=2024836 RepID=UPI002F927032
MSALLTQNKLLQLDRFKDCLDKRRLDYLVEHKGLEPYQPGGPGSLRFYDPDEVEAFLRQRSLKTSPNKTDLDHRFSTGGKGLAYIKPKRSHSAQEVEGGE